MIFSEFYAGKYAIAISFYTVLLQSGIEPNRDCVFSANSAANQQTLYRKVPVKNSNMLKVAYSRESCRVRAKNRKECVPYVTEG